MAAPSTRKERFAELFPAAPNYRSRQIEDALFMADGWETASAISKDSRAILIKEIPWMSLRPAQILESSKGDTFKAALRTVDDRVIESVLMENRRKQWTICVSSQVGCAMRCTFCATGKTGLTRNLTEDEIVDQYRFWKQWLAPRPEFPQRISNIVFMGMGEPLANVINVKRAINALLAHTDLGPTHVTVSTVGLLPHLDALLTDPEWPPVRLAVSLHSADPVTRKAVVPTSYDDFLPRLTDWCRKYLALHGNRRHHLTFEYVMLGSVNDTDLHAQKLAAFARSCGEIKVNLIPYNFADNDFVRTEPERLKAFVAILETAGVTVMVRRTMGDDIAAACGQLATAAVGR